MTGHRVYLDYNASAPLLAEAREAMLACLDLVGNPSSVHAEGRHARAAIETARSAIAGLLGVSAETVTFTSGATEANVTVIRSGWDVIYLTGLEHDSVRQSAQAAGARVVDVGVTADGLFDLSAWADIAGSEAGMPGRRALLCLQLANNETGAIQPVAAAASIARAHAIDVHCDAVQAPGRIAVSMRDLGVDTITISGHKIGAPKGVGALAVRQGKSLQPLLTGGGQERGTRAGTENVAAIAAFGAAATVALRDVEHAQHIANLRDRLETTIRHMSPAVMIAAHDAPRLPNTSCIITPHQRADQLLIRLDLAGLSVSSGSACSSGKVGHSATLAAMGLAPERVGNAIRVSIGRQTTREDIDAFLSAWKDCAAAPRRAA